MIQYCKKPNKLIALIACLMLLACSDDYELSDLCFVGDSIVARWDLPVFFPASIAENHGVSGSRIDYLESLAGKFEGRSVVIISGTNDVGRLVDLTDDKIEEYALRYIAAIQALKADKIYLYSIFPRGLEFQGKRLNPVIVKLNALIKEAAMSSPADIVYIDVYDRLLKDDVLDPQYSYDGLHLNEYGYTVITNALRASR